MDSNSLKDLVCTMVPRKAVGMAAVEDRLFLQRDFERIDFD